MLRSLAPTIQRISTSFLSLPYLLRRCIFVSIDSILILFSVWLSFWLRLSDPFHDSYISSSFWLLPLSVVYGLTIFVLSGQYTGLSRYVASSSLYRLSIRTAFLVLLLYSTGSLFSLPMPPRSSWLLLWILITSFVGLTRFILRDFLQYIRN